MNTMTTCGHCGYPIRQVAGLWCHHTDRAAYERPRHIAEPQPQLKGERDSA